MKLSVNLKEKSYDIFIEDGLLDKVDGYLDSKKRYFIVTDDFVPSEYLEKLESRLKNSNHIVMRHGEKTKNLRSFEKILSRLLELNYGRKDYIIALGGGVIGDLTGFVAASFKRGMHFINIPTTTLSMVDSSIGGKVAVDMNGIKNCVGAFYQPDMVLIDPLVLKTLPKRHINNGLIEALKSGLIGDMKLYELFRKGNPIDNIHEIIYRSLSVKKRVVEEDEKEESIRKILNFGHTIGHAYESYFDLKTYLHGEAVALGMADVTRFEPYHDDLMEILRKMVKKMHPEFDREKLLSYIKNDKKASGDFVDLVLVHDIGSALIEKTPISELEKYLEVK